MEVFFRLLNHDWPPRSDFFPDVPIGVEPYACNDGVPSVEEVEKVIQRLNNCKALGKYGIPPEILKCCPHVAVP